jgi:hypothetical protein
MHGIGSAATVAADPNTPVFSPRILNFISKCVDRAGMKGVEDICQAVKIGRVGRHGMKEASR